MKNFFAFKNVASETEAELSIHDEISFWGVQAKDFIASLKSIKAPVLNLHINSPGGSVVDGYAIYNMLRASGKQIVVHVDGIAASIAAVIAMAGNKIKMPENALMFIHDPLVNYAGGNATELRKVADDLDKIREGILNIFEARTGSDRAKISKLMAEETLMTAKEAVKLGFADEVLPEQQAQNSAFKLVDYHPGIKLPTNVITPVAAVGQPDNKDTTMTEKEQAALDAATSRVSVLEGENTSLKTSVEQARNKAQQDAQTAENTRKTSIKEFAAKYNQNGDLNDEIINALAGTTTLDQFKDKVLDVVNARPAKQAIKPGGDAGTDPTDAQLTKEYEACKTAGDRAAFVAKNRAWMRAQARLSRRG